MDSRVRRMLEAFGTSSSIEGPMAYTTYTVTPWSPKVYQITAPNLLKESEEASVFTQSWLPWLPFTICPVSLPKPHVLPRCHDGGQGILDETPGACCQAVAGVLWALQWQLMGGGLAWTMSPYE